MDITDFTRDFTRDEQQKLFSANIWVHIQEQRRRLNGSGCGDGVSRAPQQISDVAAVGEDADNAPAEGGDNAGRG